MEKALPTHKFVAVVAAIAVVLLLACLPAKAEAYTNMSDCTVELSENWWINYNREKGPDPNDFIVKRPDGTVMSKNYYDLELSGYELIKGGGDNEFFRVKVIANLYDFENGVNIGTTPKNKSFLQELIPISKATITLPQSPYECTGKPCEPAVTISYMGKTLSSKYYSLEYDHNIDAGPAYAIISGKGAFYGTTSESYEIRLDLSKCTVKMSPNELVYNPDYSVQTLLSPRIELITNYGKALVSTGEFDYEYPNSRDAGTASVVVSARSNSRYYYGKATGTFRIKPRRVNSCDTPSKLAYTGKSLKLPVQQCKLQPDESSPLHPLHSSSRKLKEGVDYTIKYSRIPKAVGTYTATITFKGNYSGTFKKKFKILPGRPDIKKTKATKTQVKVSWKKVRGATGYKVYRWNDAKGKYTLYKTTKSTSCIIKRRTKSDQVLKFRIKAYTKKGAKTYYSESEEWDECLKPSKPVFSVKSTGYGTVDVSVNGSGSYQVQVCQNSGFYYVRSQTGHKSWFSFYGFDNSNKVYVRVRWYFYHHGSLVVGPWSVKSCKLY